ATCGDCHGSHNIQYLTTGSYSKDFFYSGEVVCGKCHEEEYANYNDYYHGRAYKTKAPDSPACWDCHNGHIILSSTVPESSVHAKNIVETCGKCHPGSTAQLMEYVPLIHTSEKAQIKLVEIIRDRAGKIFEKIPQPISKVTSQPKEWMVKIVQFFFPPSLRPEEEGPDEQLLQPGEESTDQPSPRAEEENTNQ
ncbi:MAG: hypothetical protein KAS39_07430, partial [Actinomycetia bacterium]|nr:hypothetical protein [Actinomycetes bacterium]